MGSRTRFLCAMHAGAKAAAGADVRPFRVHTGIADLGVIMPEKTPMQLVRELARSVLAAEQRAAAALLALLICEALPEAVSTHQLFYII